MLSEVASNVAGTPCDCRACWYPRVYWLIGPLSNVSDTVVCTAAWADGMATDTPPMSRLRQTTIRATRVATEPGPPRNRTVRRLNGLKGASPQETENHQRPGRERPSRPRDQSSKEFAPHRPEDRFHRGNARCAGLSQPPSNAVRLAYPCGELVDETVPAVVFADLAHDHRHLPRERGNRAFPALPQIAG